MKKSTKNKLTKAFVLTALVSSIASGAMANSRPTINLFPTSVVEQLRNSATSAQELEDGMQPIVAQLEKQMDLYKSSQCDTADADQGCAQIRKTLGETYSQMLGQLSDRLPSLRTAMSSIKSGVGTRIRKELGNKMTPRDLQRMLGGERDDKRIRNISGKRKSGRISGMLSKYSEMISMTNTHGGPTPALAAEIYLDSVGAMNEIEAMEMNIAHARTTIELGGYYFGEPSEAMVATVQGVKGLLFGEVDDVTIPDDAIQGEEKQDVFDDSALRF